MEQLKNINSEAAQYVTDAGIERWAPAYSPRKRYKLMSTNIAEAMNNAIKECKELPITGVIDYIKGVLQSWFLDRRTTALKLTTQLTTAADVAIGAKLRAEEAKRAALEAEQKASKEAVDREAAEVSKRISAEASKDEAPGRQMVGSSRTSNAQSKESGANGIEKSQSAGKFYV
ncbi:hypothetical protein LWI28_023047 [Acer negundo]|uniref:Uncharacterized protein n=1 Tax=Acer negundo TaxID=4023 RepID=A0AAD5NKG0_ACENE|nr:hypothetical protein LWI28_023047 [Acer negundo]